MRERHKRRGTSDGGDAGCFNKEGKSRHIDGGRTRHGMSAFARRLAVCGSLGAVFVADAVGPGRLRVIPRPQVGKRRNRADRGYGGHRQQKCSHDTPIPHAGILALPREKNRTIRFKTL